MANGIASLDRLAEAFGQLRRALDSGEASEINAADRHREGRH
jgi:hypothetical protein